MTFGVRNKREKHILNCSAHAILLCAQLWRLIRVLAAQINARQPLVLGIGSHYCFDAQMSVEGN